MKNKDHYRQELMVCGLRLPMVVSSPQWHGAHWALHACVPLVRSWTEWPCLNILSGQVFDPEITLLRIFPKERMGQGLPDFCRIIYKSRQTTW